MRHHTPDDGLSLESETYVELKNYTLDILLSPLNIINLIAFILYKLNKNWIHNTNLCFVDGFDPYSYGEISTYILRLQQMVSC